MEQLENTWTEREGDKKENRRQGSCSPADAALVLYVVAAIDVAYSERKKREKHPSSPHRRSGNSTAGQLPMQ
jgi:hypothetical protein